MSKSRVKRVLAIGGMTGMTILAILVSADVAHADSATLTSGTYKMAAGTVYEFSAKRTDSYSRNIDAYDVTGVYGANGRNDVNAALALAMRSASTGKTYARNETLSRGTFVRMPNDNGNTWNPAGSFYLNAEVETPTNDSPYTFKGDLSFNVKY